MNSTDIFMPSSYDTGPTSFLSHFGPEDQLFQQPLLNAIGQNYVPNPRPPPPPQQQQQQQQQQQNEQRDTTFDNSYARISPQHRTGYMPPQQPATNNNQYQQQQQPPSNRQIAYNNDSDPFSEYHDMYAPSQYQRPPPAPSQQRQPPSQQQRIMPPPPPQQQQYYEEQIPRSTHPSNNQEMFFTDHNDDQLDQLSYQQPPSMTNQRNVDQQNDQDSRRQGKEKVKEFFK